MDKKTETKQMCPVFQEIFKKFRSGIDFLILHNDEAYQGRDEFGKPDGKIEHYNFKLDEIQPQRDHWMREKEYLSESNCGVTVAYDMATKTLICTARPDVIQSNDSSLFVPFRRDMGIIPADPAKYAAFQYQIKVDEMLSAEKEAERLNNSLSNLIRNARQAGR